MAVRGPGVQRRGRLRDGGEQGRLAHAELVELLAQVDVRRRRDALCGAVGDLVEVGRDDGLLALLAGEGLGELVGLQQLLGLAQVEALAWCCPR